MSLYRKYRPRNFPDLIGQEHIKVTLLNAVKAGQVAHAYLFTGPRGTGKTTTARLLAKAINVEEMTEDGRFDGSEIAEEIDTGRLIDVIEIDAASNRGIDEIRDLREKISYAPTRAKNKVYIIDEVHMLTKEAFNALLKTLEEPPSFVFFILATTEIQKVPETIISRCQRFDFRRITEEVLIEHLRHVALNEQILAEDEALQIVAKHARGGARDALTLFEQLTSGNKLESARVKEVLGMSNLAACEGLYQHLENAEAAKAMDHLHAIFQSGVDLLQFNRDFLDFLRQKMLEAVRQTAHDDARRLIGLLEFFQEAYEKQKYSYIPELPLEVAIARSCLKQVPSSAHGAAKDGGRSAEDEQKKKSEVTATTKKAEGQRVTEGQAAGTDVTSSDGLETIMQRWGLVLERVHNPLARRCLSAGKPIELCDDRLTLAFQNNFNKDKLFIPELLAEVEQTIEETCQIRVKLIGKVDANQKLVEIAPASSAKIDGAIENENPKQNDPSLLESALNVFGGEVV